MKILAVDDEQLALEYLEKQIRELDASYEVTAFSDPLDALEYAGSHPADIAFLDIEMFGMTGIELAKRLKDVQSNISIVFVTGFSQYAVDAFSVHACGYLLKPPKKEAIEAEIALIQTQRANAAPVKSSKRVRIQTFGSFEIFVDGEPVKFGRSKSKELLAYLVDRRGSSATVQELIGVLFEDRDSDASTASLLRVLVADMIHSLQAVHADDIIQKRRNSLALDMDQVDCDYSDFLAGDTAAINRYMGEYMSNYSWAEFTTGALDKKAELY